MASKALIKKLDTAFSKYIRLRDSHDGIFTCCSCGQMKPYEQADAGHFINRRWMAVRWDERNVHAQCRYDNRFDEGSMLGYYRFMLNKYGQNTIDVLESKKVNHKWYDSELQILIGEYKRKIKELENEMGIN